MLVCWDRPDPAGRGGTSRTHSMRRGGGADHERIPGVPNPCLSYNSGMRNYLMTKAPWWLLVLINGGSFWIVSLIGKALAPSWWPLDGVEGGIAALLYGLSTATLTAGARGRRSSDKTDS